MNNPSPESCRHWLDGEINNNCYAPAVVIVWGKLHPLDDLGPRCMDHLPKPVAYHYSRHGNFEGYAAFDLRPYWTEQD